jgi:hypothetical protein
MKSRANQATASWNDTMALSPTDDRGALFMESLNRLVTSTQAARDRLERAFGEVPEPVRMIVALYWLWLVVPSGGVGAFLELRDPGGRFEAAEAWCRLIGARRAAAYLRATRRLCPGGRVPVSADHRRRIRDELMSRVPDPLAALDARYHGAIDEIPTRLRMHLPSHAEDVVAWLTEDPRRSRDGRRRSESPARRAPVVAGNAVKGGSGPGKRRAPSGSGSVDLEALSGRVDDFVTRLESLDSKQWILISAAYQRALKKVQPALEAAQAVADAIWREERPPAGRSVTAWLAASKELDARIQRITEALPETASVAGETQKVRRAAKIALVFPINALRAYAELAQMADGRRAADALLAPLVKVIGPL